MWFLSRGLQHRAVYLGDLMDTGIRLHVAMGKAVEVPLFLLLLHLYNSGYAKGEEDNNQCSDCHLHENIGPIHQKQTSSECQYPCKCSNQEIQCKAGVNIVRDGCDCCYMCARQQGDLCNYRDRCDEEKGLYCDFQMGDGIRGICRAKAAKSCEIDGKVYKDGAEFKPHCDRICSCQNGIYSCSSLCPQHDRQPSNIHCKVPRLVNITGRCCKEWVCPNSNSFPDRDEFLQPTKGSTKGSLVSPCKIENTLWSPCTVTCGMGVSLRISADNEKCQMVHEKRLCFIRPCELNDTVWNGRRCKNTWRQSNSIKFQYNGCSSVKEYRPKYCSSCKRKRCCVPEKTKTNAMEWMCSNGQKVVHDFMWIKSCVCSNDC